MAVVAADDAGLIEPSEQGVNIIRSHGEDPDLCERLRKEWHTDAENDWDLYEEFKRIAEEGDDDRRR
jgi:hypothetical protein